MIAKRSMTTPKLYIVKLKYLNFFIIKNSIVALRVRQLRYMMRYLRGRVVQKNEKLPFIIHVWLRSSFLNLWQWILQNFFHPEGEVWEKIMWGKWMEDKEWGRCSEGIVFIIKHIDLFPLQSTGSHLVQNYKKCLQI